MVEKRNASLVLRTAKQIAAVTAPVRQEILTALGEIGPASVGRLAEQLGRTPNSLYYHVGLLTKAGVLAEEGGRGSGSRREAVYRVTHKRIVVGPAAGSRKGVEAAQKVIGAILRQTGREVVDALRSSDVRRDGADRELFGIRGKGRLTRAEVREVNRLVTRIEEILRDACTPGRNGRMLAFTAVLTPCRDRTRSDRGQGRRKADR